MTFFVGDDVFLTHGVHDFVPHVREPRVQGRSQHVVPQVASIPQKSGIGDDVRDTCCGRQACCSVPLIKSVLLLFPFIPVLCLIVGRYGEYLYKKKIA